MKPILYILLSVCLLAACRKIETPAPNMDVTLTKTTYSVNDTVRFQLSGDIENIVFYSGEVGSRYDSQGQVTVDKGKTLLDFKSQTAGSPRANSLKLLITNNLDVVNSGSIVAANWTDITSRAVLATGTTAVSSGAIDITEFYLAGKPVRIAYKYEAATSATLAQPIWSMTAFNINTSYSDGTVVPITTIANAQWAAFDIKNPLAQWTISASQVRIDGGAKSSPDNEDWVVTGPLDLQTSRELSDYGKSIKNLSSSALTQYQYVFTKPGTYTVTFVGFNHSINEQKTVVKQFKITVN